MRATAVGFSAATLSGRVALSRLQCSMKPSRYPVWLQCSELVLNAAQRASGRGASDTRPQCRFRTTYCRAVASQWTNLNVASRVVACGDPFGWDRVFRVLHGTIPNSRLSPLSSHRVARNRTSPSTNICATALDERNGLVVPVPTFVGILRHDIGESLTTRAVGMTGENL